MTELRPMELGEIVDRSAAFWRGHWRKLYGLFLAFNLAQYALLKAFQAAQERWAPLTRGGAATLKAVKDNQAEFLVQEAWAGLGIVVFFLIVVFVTLVETTAATRYVMPAFLGQPADVLGGVRHAMKRLGTLTGLFVLAIAWSVLVLLLCLLPGGALVAGGFATVDTKAISVTLLILGMLAMLLGLIGWGLWFFLRFALWGQVVAMEDLGAVASFRRCDALTSGRVGPGFMGFVKVRLMVLITVVGVLLMLIGLLSGAPALVLRAIYGNIFDPLNADPNAVPQLLLVPAELLNIAVSSLVYPLYVAFLVTFYVDMRTRREGLDLELKMKAAV